MSIQDNILTAKQVQQSEIPVYVVPDEPGGQRPSYGNERVGLSGPGMYQFPGKNVYSPFAPGTKTLASRGFDEEKRAKSVAEALAKQELEANKKAQEEALKLDWYNATHKSSGSRGSSGGLTPYQLLQLMQKQEEKASDWVERIIKETSPTKITEGLTGEVIEGKNKFYDVGAKGAMHAYPEKALKAYKTLIPADIYNEVARQVRGYYGYEGDPTTLKPAGTSVSEFKMLDQRSANQAQKW